jgi:hypothetical protein
MQAQLRLRRRLDRSVDRRGHREGNRDCAQHHPGGDQQGKKSQVFPGNHDLVLQATFKYLALLRSSPFPTWYQQELAKLSTIRFEILIPGCLAVKTKPAEK